MACVCTIIESVEEHCQAANEVDVFGLLELVEVGTEYHEGHRCVLQGRWCCRVHLNVRVCEVLYLVDGVHVEDQLQQQGEWVEVHSRVLGHEVALLCFVVEEGLPQLNFVLLFHF